jgi:membrane protease YdiL (CAAX protease family)
MPLLRLVQALWRAVLSEPRRLADDEARAEWAGGGQSDTRLVVVLVVAALCLTGLEYLAMSNRYPDMVALLDLAGFRQWACWLDANLDGLSRTRHCADGAAWQALHPVGPNPTAELGRLTYWAVGCLVFYFVIPAAVVKFVLRAPLADYGLRVRGAFSDAWIYAIFLCVVLPLVWVVSGDPHFQRTYPFYTLGPAEPLWPRFWMWEILYFSQFFALEFFFRGFMVHGLRHRLGWGAVPVMMVPYCMIHFGKPLPETIGAIIAGIALGSLSLRTRSIWLGVCIHVTVALCMDLASLWRQGLLL